MVILKIILLVIATWRLYHLFAFDTGPGQILRRFRERLGVEYSDNYTNWATREGSIGETITCVKCAPLYWGLLLTLALLFLETRWFLLVTLPLVAGAVTMFLEMLHNRSRKEEEEKDKLERLLDNFDSRW